MTLMEFADLLSTSIEGLPDDKVPERLRSVFASIPAAQLQRPLAQADRGLPPAYRRLIDQFSKGTWS